MALQITGNVETPQGITVTNPFIFLNINLFDNADAAQLRWYASQQAWKDGKNPIEPVGMPLQVDMKIPNQVFWGNGQGNQKGLANAIHNTVKTELVKIFGGNNVDIIQDPNI